MLKPQPEFVITEHVNAPAGERPFNRARYPFALMEVNQGFEVRKGTPIGPLRMSMSLQKRKGMTFKLVRYDDGIACVRIA